MSLLPLFRMIKAHEEPLRVIFRTKSNREVFLYLLGGEDYAGGIMVETDLSEPTVFRAINELFVAGLIEKSTKRKHAKMGGPHNQIWRVKSEK